MMSVVRRLRQVALLLVLLAGPAVADQDGINACDNFYSVVVEFKDYVAVFDAPHNDDRSGPVIAETHRLVPDKPTRIQHYLATFPRTSCLSAPTFRYSQGPARDLQ